MKTPLVTPTNVGWSIRRLSSLVNHACVHHNRTTAVNVACGSIYQQSKNVEKHMHSKLAPIKSKSIHKGSEGSGFHEAYLGSL